MSKRLLFFTNFDIVLLGSDHMKLKKNELKIIQLLLASPDYISTYDIATSTGIPRRLVRDEISNVRVIL